MSFGRSRARRVEAADQHVTFEDVAGIDEAKEELTEIVDFLKNPDKYLRSAAGSRAACCSAARPGPARRCWRARSPARPGVPFFQMSASEFVEMIVGVGASRVRDLFAAGQDAPPGDHLHRRARRDRPLARRAAGRTSPGGHDEREQTLNQILTEMDGFDPRERRDRARRDQPPRGPRPGAAAPRPLRPPRRRCSRRTAPGARRSSRSTPARCRSPTTSTSVRSPRRPRAWSAPTSPTSSTRRRCWPRARNHEQVDQRGLHRRARADRARRRAQGDDVRRGPPPHRLPRGGPRDRRDAHPRRRPGSQGLDHPPRPGARASPSRPPTPTASTSTSAT